VVKQEAQLSSDRSPGFPAWIALSVWVTLAGGCGDLTLTALLPVDAGAGGSDTNAAADTRIDASGADAGIDTYREGDAQRPGDLAPADDANPCAGRPCGTDCTPPGMGMLVTCNAQGQCVAGPVDCS
jgi:hypothetical protein